MNTAKAEQTGYYSPKYETEYRGFGIVRKNDFGNHGFLDQGHMITEGFIVVQDGSNAIPGAGWFKTVQQAKNGIDDLIKSREDVYTGREHPFHKRNRLRRSLNTRSLELFEAVLNHLEETYDATGGAHGKLREVLATIVNDCDTRATVDKTRVGDGVERIGKYDPQMKEILAGYGLTEDFAQFGE